MRMTTAHDPAAQEGQRGAAAASDEPREIESAFERELRVNGWADVDTFHCTDCGHTVPIVAIEGREGLFRARHTTTGGLTGGDATVCGPSGDECENSGGECDADDGGWTPGNQGW